MSSSKTSKHPWEGTRREPDVFDAIRGGKLTGNGPACGMVNDHDPFRSRAEEVTGNLILVQPDDPMWIALNKAVRDGDIYQAISLRNRMVLAGKLTITERFSPS